MRNTISRRLDDKLSQWWKCDLHKIQRGAYTARIPIKISPSIGYAGHDVSVIRAYREVELTLEPFQIMVHISQDALESADHLKIYSNHVVDLFADNISRLIESQMLINHFKNNFSPSERRIAAVNEEIHVVPRDDRYMIQIALAVRVGALPLKNDPKMNVLEKTFCVGCSERLKCNIARFSKINKEKARCINIKNLEITR
jgi:hypothetical protein